MTDAPPAQKKPDPCAFVIFGVTGDLTHRLVIPALYNLAAADLLPDPFCVVGVARKAGYSFVPTPGDWKLVRFEKHIDLDISDIPCASWKLAAASRHLANAPLAG